MIKKKGGTDEELFKLSEKHNMDLKEIIHAVIKINVPKDANQNPFQSFFPPSARSALGGAGKKATKTTKPPSKKQLKALKEGRKKLAELRPMKGEK